MKREKVDSITHKLKKNIQREYLNNSDSNVLELVSVCACVLYETNISYMDDFLESMLQKVARRIKDADPRMFHLDQADEDAVVFYDGFGLNNRGLAGIYLRALGKSKKIYYITYAHRKAYIPDILSLVSDCGGEALFLEDGSKLSQIRQLNEFVCHARAKHFLLYTYPHDTVAPTLLYGFDSSLTRYQINLTDHAFWLGAGCMDRCIEFREYGANISSEYRNIPRQILTVLPIYPSVDYDHPFLGYPFELQEGQKVIFSGGALYKTFGEDNLYYRIVDRILCDHHDAVFWYAGSGDDSQIRQLCQKHPGRVYLSKERPDLHQVLKHCHFLLNTYPVSGGLMYQHAACAGRVPVTLRFDDDNDGMLIAQRELQVDFDTPEELAREVRLLMEDADYYQERSRKMSGSVITEAGFAEALDTILAAGSSGFPIRYRHLDTEKFRERALQIQKEHNLNCLFVRKNAAMLMLKYHPVRFALGAVQSVLNRLH